MKRKITILAVLAIFFYVGYLLVAKPEQIKEKKAEISQLQSQLLKEMEELAELKEKIFSIGTDEWVKEVAQEISGFVEDK